MEVRHAALVERDHLTVKLHGSDCSSGSNPVMSQPRRLRARTPAVGADEAAEAI
jgi:hypothetical protein